MKISADTMGGGGEFSSAVGAFSAVMELSSDS
jgi:hypothetical protein